MPAADAPAPELHLPAICLSHADALLARGGRVLLGIVGPPGAGKSTLAAALQAAFRAESQVVPMDGFHLAQAELGRLGRAGRKGAPDTFDAAGYAALLRRLKAQQPAGGDGSGGETVYAPAFCRDLEEPIAGAIAVEPSTRLVITEGNYLLLGEGDDAGRWAPVAALLDEAWYVDVDDALRTERLVARHQQFGRSREAALAWVAATDEPNARRIAASRHLAQLRVRWDEEAG